MSKWCHWCPKGGCGKKVRYEGLKEDYVCQLCGRKYTREEILDKDVIEDMGNDD